jgi:hypothetical protein
MLKTIVLATAFALGAVATASAYTPAEMALFDRTSKPYHEGWTGLQSIMPEDAFASANAPQARSVRPFTAGEKALFDRTSKPYDE